MFLTPTRRHPQNLAHVMLGDWLDDAERSAREPALDIVQTADGWQAKLDMPGIEKSAISVQIEGRHVQVQASGAKCEERKEGERVIYRERRASRYVRSFVLPSEVDQAQSLAKLENGVLTLSLARRGGPVAGSLTVN
jgi:HSP20 family protein